MNISDIASLYSGLQAWQTSAANSTNSANSSNSASATAQTDPVKKAFASSAARLDKDIQATNVQVSAYAQVKSGFARVEDAGKALASGAQTTSATSTTSPTTAADIKKGLQALVSAYNDTRSAAASAGSGSASIASNDLCRTAAANSNHADLRALGVTQQKDGSLVLDTKALDKALQTNPDNARAAAGRVGGQLQQTASRVLASSGSVGSTLNALNARAQALETRQTEQQSLTSAAQQAMQQQAASLSNSVSGIGSYLSVFSL